MDIWPINEAEAAKRARGEIWVSNTGDWMQDWYPPKKCGFVPLGEVRGDWIGRRVLRQRNDFTHVRGLYVMGPSVLGVQLPGAPALDCVYVPLVDEPTWWAHKLTGASLGMIHHAAVTRVWLDESEDPTPR